MPEAETEAVTLQLEWIYIFWVLSKSFTISLAPNSPANMISLGYKVTQQHRRTLLCENFSLKALCDSIQYATVHAWMEQNGLACRRISLKFPRKNGIKGTLDAGGSKRELAIFKGKNQNKQELSGQICITFPREHFVFKCLAENCLFILCWQINVDADGFSFYSFVGTFRFTFFFGKVEYWKSCNEANIVRRRCLHSKLMKIELWVNEL